MVLCDFAICNLFRVLKHIPSGPHDAEVAIVVARVVFLRCEKWPELGHFKSVERYSVVLGGVDLQGEREQVRPVALIVVA